MNRLAMVVACATDARAASLGVDIAWIRLGELS